MWSLKKNISTIAKNNNLPFLSLFDARDYKDNFSSSAFLKDLSKLKEWTQKGLHGDMTFLEENHSVRQDLNLILPNVKSILMFLVPYALPKRLRRMKNIKQSEKTTQSTNKESLLAKELIGKYAQAKDYHKVLKRKLIVTYTAIKTVIAIYSKPLLQIGRKTRSLLKENSSKYGQKRGKDLF